MAVSALDSRVFRNLFGTQEIRDVFTDEAYVKCMVEVEAALARSQSKTGVIPPCVGDSITDAFADLKLEYVDASNDVTREALTCGIALIVLHEKRISWDTLSFLLFASLWKRHRVRHPSIFIGERQHRISWTMHRCCRSSADSYW